MPPRDVLQNDNLQVPRLVLALLNSQGNVDRSALARAPRVFATDDPTGVTGENPGALIVGTDGTLRQVDADGSTLRLFRTSEAGGTQPDLIFAAATELTIASGVVTATQGSHLIDTEGDAASDDLDQIDGLAAEELSLLRPANAARTVVLRDASVAGGSANIYTPGQQSISLAEAADWALVASDGTRVVVLAFRTQALAGGGLGAALAGTSTGLGAALVGIEDAETLFAAATVEGALTENAQKVAALGAENTDGQLQIPLLAGLADGGTWTAAVTSGGLVSVARTAADAPDSFWVEIPVPSRTSASKGIKPTGLRVNYSVATADAADVRFELWKVTQGADGAARTAAVLFGDADEDYDAAHDTAVKRGDDTAAPELHLAVVSDAGTPAYLAAGETLMLRCYVDGDAGPASVVTVTSAVLLFSETLVDLA